MSLFWGWLVRQRKTCYENVYNNDNNNIGVMIVKTLSFVHIWLWKPKKGFLCGENLQGLLVPNLLWLSPIKNTKMISSCVHTVSLWYDIEVHKSLVTSTHELVQKTQKSRLIMELNSTFTKAMTLLHEVNFLDGTKQIRNFFFIQQEIKHNHPTK